MKERYDELNDIWFSGDLDDHYANKILDQSENSFVKLYCGADLRTLLKSRISIEKRNEIWTQAGHALKRVHSMYREKCN